IDFGQRMSRATRGRRVELDEKIEARLMMNMIAVEHGDEHRGVEECVHSDWPRFDASRSSRTRPKTPSVTSAESPCPAENTQTPCFFRSGPVPRRGRKVI